MAVRKKTEPTTTWSEASEELEAILDEIEGGAADIDVLSEKVERAAELIQVCRQKLSGTELRVQKVVEELARTETPGDETEDDG